MSRCLYSCDACVFAPGLVTDKDADLLVRAAMAHLNLVMVHPFRYGNGRMARALQTCPFSGWHRRAGL